MPARLEGVWGAFARQPAWHFWIERGVVSRAACGASMMGGEFEAAPEDLTGQRLCKACSRRLERSRASQGRAADA